MKLNEGIESSPCTLEVSYIWGDVNTASGCASIIMPLYSTFLNLKKVNICIYIYIWLEFSSNFASRMFNCACFFSAKISLHGVML